MNEKAADARKKKLANHCCVLCIYTKHTKTKISVGKTTLDVQDITGQVSVHICVRRLCVSSHTV